MSVRRTVALIGRALRPGADLSQSTAADLSRDPQHVASVDALTAMGRLKEPAGAAALHARLGGEEAKAVKLVLLEWAVIEFERQKWTIATRKYSRPVLMRRFVDQVYREYAGRPCQTCAGTRFVHRSAKVKVCPSCEGSGRVRSTVRARAKALGFGKTIVAKVWRERFAVVLSELRRIERAALFETANYLFGDENP